MEKVGESRIDCGVGQENVLGSGHTLIGDEDPTAENRRRELERMRMKKVEESENEAIAILERGWCSVSLLEERVGGRYLFIRSFDDNYMLKLVFIFKIIYTRVIHE